MQAQRVSTAAHGTSTVTRQDASPMETSSMENAAPGAGTKLGIAGGHV